MDALKKTRSPLRSGFTKTATNVEELITAPEPDSDSLAVLISQLNEKFDRLNDIDEKIIALLQQDDSKATDDDFTAEIESVESYREKFIALRTKAERVLKKIECKSSNVNIDPIDSVVGKRNYKLPKIELKKFNGEVIDWLGFWGQFKKIHDDPDIDPEDKYQYLLQSTEAGTRARDLVESFPPNAENYPKVIEYLKLRFGRDDVLVEVYVRELLRLVLKNADNTTPKTSLIKLYDKIEAYLRSLETLGVTTDKYAAMLYPLVEACLSEDLIRTWERTQSSIDRYSKCGEEVGASNKSFNKLQLLMQFLRSEVEGEERISLVKSGFGVGHNAKPKVGPKPHKTFKTETPTAAGLLSGNKINRNANQTKTCIFCSKNHESQDCKFAQKWTMEDKKKLLTQKGCCYVCLKPGHMSRNCRNPLTCLKCRGRHFAILCPDTRYLEQNSKSPETENHKFVTDKDQVLTNRTCTNEILLQTLIVRVRGKGDTRLMRALIDTGSQKSYICKDAVEVMKYDSLGEEKMTHSLFGGKESCETHHKYRIYLSNLESDYHCNFEVFDQQTICDSIPKIHQGPWTAELRSRGIKVSDQDCNEAEVPSEIQILIGADVAGKLMTGSIHQLNCGLVAIETRLGWTLMGKFDKGSNCDTSMLVLTLHVSEAKISDLWDLDSLGISDPFEHKKREELHMEAKDHFFRTVKRNPDGRYEVSLPWIEGHPKLPSYQALAEKRLKSTLKSLKSKNKLEAYENVFREWHEEGIIEKVNPSKNEDVNCHYLPHRAVFKENSSTKIRPVFDGSAHTEKHPSLNDCLEKGPNLVELIPTVLNRFRLNRYGVIADIRKAFLQIGLNERDRDYLRFLWWEGGNPECPVVYRHRRVVFGVSSSPFLLGATLDYHLNNVPSHLTETADRLKNSLYVDNCVTSLENETDLNKFIVEAKEIMSMAKFDLRGWQWNSSSISQRDTEADTFSLNLTTISETDNEANVPVLGLLWNLKDDTISVDLRGINDSEVKHLVTKRKILSRAHQIFDPIGFTCPVTLKPKLLLQKCWQLKFSWDKELPDEIKREFQKWENGLHFLRDIAIPRHMCGFPLSESNVSLHVFCDASKNAYATCIFLRAERGDGEVQCQLVQARTRVSPLKKMTIPRLELMACCIGARLHDTVKRDLNFKEISSFYWTDSADALHWIKRNESWGTFVMNRVKEIRSLTDMEAWNFVPGTLNPADIPSRGCSAKRLLESQWWEGPDWLKQSPEYWPRCEIFPHSDVVNSEKRKSIVSAANTGKENFLENISSYTKIVRITAWIYRFYNNANSRTNRLSGNLKVEEISYAERTILKYVQKQYSEEECNKKLSLPVFRDAEGLIRVTSKITKRNDLELFRHPILLPSDHPIVSKIILEKHEELNHAGVHILMTALRETYWILKSRKTIRHVIHRCIKCKRFTARHAEVLSAPLPEDRVREAAVFEIIGVDLAGPLFLKDRKKSWIVLFTCAVYRAVHLELVTSLSTNSFLQALRRFVSRRGRPTIIYSDNGTNLVGASNELKSLNWGKIQQYANVRRIEWKFNPPAAPWWGGFWERLIGMLKGLLRRILGRACLDYEELNTILCDTESIINSRPLTYVSEDPEDLVALTPAMFLQEIREVGVPDLDQIEDVQLNKRFAYRQRIREDIRKRFRIEYLGQLRQSASSKGTRTPIQEGDVVLVGNDNSKRIDWPLAKVIKTYPAEDGKIRLVKLKMRDGEHLRAVQRLYPLEITDRDAMLPVTRDFSTGTAIKKTGDKELLPTDSPNQIIDANALPTKTRSGRIVKRPQRLINLSLPVEQL